MPVHRWYKNFAVSPLKACKWLQNVIMNLSLKTVIIGVPLQQNIDVYIILFDAKSAIAAVSLCRSVFIKLYQPSRECLYLHLVSFTKNEQNI